MERVTRIVTENGVVIFSKSSCCMCYAVKFLFGELGVEPMVYEIDQDPEGKEIERFLVKQGCTTPLLAVFIGGNLLGSTNDVMSLHLRGALVPLLEPYQTLA